MKQILLLGGTSFASENTAKEMINQGYHIDILTRGILPIKYTGINEHIICDRTCPDKVRLALKNKRYDLIVDFSARTGADIETILNAINISDCIKYVLISTASIFDVPDDGFISDSVFLKKNTDDNPYISGKLHAENTLKNSGIPYVIIRPTYIFGNNDPLRRIDIIFNALKHEIPIFVPSQKCLCNPICLNDISQAVLLAATDEAFSDIAVFLGGNDIVDFEQFINICSDICNINANIIHTKKESEKFIRMPFLPISVIVDSSCQFMGKMKYTPLKKALETVYFNLY